jgi:adenine-specific DNA-methyltransferase
MAKKQIEVEALRHKDKRCNIPTAELEPVMDEKDKTPIRLAYERRNRDLDPQLVWRGKDEQDWSDLIVQAPPLYIQEKVHPKVLIDDLLRQSKERREETAPPMPDLFADFNGLPDKEALTEFYQHDANWSNRMILGDSLSVMASLAEREGLRGKVQCIYIDPPYGINFNKNFQWSTTDPKAKEIRDHLTHEPEPVKAFRDTWRDGIHSYLTYLRDRLTVARDLLADSGSIFVQIGDENVHRVRALMDEVFGGNNAISQIAFQKTTSSSSDELSAIFDYLLWYRKSDAAKYRALFIEKSPGDAGATQYAWGQRQDGLRRTLSDWVSRDTPEADLRIFAHDNILSQRPVQGEDVKSFSHNGMRYDARKGTFKTDLTGLRRLSISDRLMFIGNTLRYVRFLNDFNIYPYSNLWTDTTTSGFADPKLYVVWTNKTVIERCILMSTDPGDLVLDPTCGSGTTAYVAEQWGRRWITIDTSRVALALARARIMGARYPYYLLADSKEGQRKEGEITRTPPKETPTRGDIRQGFVYERVPHITLKSIANNAEIDVIWEKWQETLEPLRGRLNAALGRGASFETPAPQAPQDEGNSTLASRLPQDEEAPNSTSWPPHAEEAPDAMIGPPHAEERPQGASRSAHEADAGNSLAKGEERPWEEWEIPREAASDWPEEAVKFHSDWWAARIARQKEIDASIAAKAEFEYLYDKPYSDNSRIRVAGPFTVESLSPHRVMAVDEDDSLIDGLDLADPGAGWNDFAQMVLEHLKTSGVQQAHKEDRIAFTALTPWPGDLVCAEGRYLEGDRERRAAIFLGPEFGTVARADLVEAAREAADARFDVVIACAFNFDAHSAELERIGRIPILKARMNPDLHMAGELKNTGSGNLFVVFGEPDIAVEPAGEDRIRVKIKGVDVFKPQTGEIESGGPNTIALWFIDTDYNEESFFVRHAYFLGAATDPYKALKTTLRAEIDEEAWASLRSDTSRPFPKPKSGRIAVKVINHLGDEVMKVFPAK